MKDIAIIKQLLKPIHGNKVIQYGTVFGASIIVEDDGKRNGLKPDKEPKTIEFDFDRDGNYIGFTT